MVPDMKSRAAARAAGAEASTSSSSIGASSSSAASIGSCKCAPYSPEGFAAYPWRRKCKSRLSKPGASYCASCAYKGKLISRAMEYSKEWRRRALQHVWRRHPCEQVPVQDEQQVDGPYDPRCDVAPFPASFASFSSIAHVRRCTPG
jgi:hypothetical protein